jgi:hypothetical protein
MPRRPLRAFALVAIGAILAGAGVACWICDAPLGAIVCAGIGILAVVEAG